MGVILPSAQSSKIYLLSTYLVLEQRQSCTLLQEKEKAIAASQCVDRIEQNKGCAQGWQRGRDYFEESANNSKLV